MKARGADARGVAVIDDKTSEADLDTMARAGIRGIRLNLATGGDNDPSVGRNRFGRRRTHKGARLARPDYTNPADDPGIKDLMMASPVPVVFDHFGGAQAAHGVEQPGFADLVDLVRSGKAYVKISGAYRASKRSPIIPISPPRESVNSRQPRPHRLGHRLAASRSSLPTRPRRPPNWNPVYQIDDGRLLNLLPRVGAGCGDPQEDPGRQSRRSFTGSEARRSTSRPAHGRAGRGR